MHMALGLIFHALNRYTCREVLDILVDGPLSVWAIHSRVKVVSRPSVSQALALLLEARLVTRRRIGRENYYELRLAGWKELAKFSSRFAALAEG